MFVQSQPNAILLQKCRVMNNCQKTYAEAGKSILFIFNVSDTKILSLKMCFLWLEWLISNKFIDTLNKNLLLYSSIEIEKRNRDEKNIFIMIQDSASSTVVSTILSADFN